MTQTLCAPPSSCPRKNISKRMAVDQLLSPTYAVVLAGGRGARLKQMTDGCAKPAVPFAGLLKIIDLTLS